MSTDHTPSLLPSHNVCVNLQDDVSQKIAAIFSANSRSLQDAKAQMRSLYAEYRDQNIELWLSITDLQLNEISVLPKKVTWDEIVKYAYQYEAFICSDACKIIHLEGIQ